MQSSRPVRVAIVESQLLFAHALRGILSGDDGITIVAVEPAVTERLLRDVAPDLVLVDVDNARIDLDAMLELFASAAPASRIVALSLAEEVPALLETPRVHAYWSKKGTAAGLVAVVRSAAEGCLAG